VIEKNDQSKDHGGRLEPKMVDAQRVCTYAKPSGVVRYSSGIRFRMIFWTYHIYLDLNNEQWIPGISGFQPTCETL